MTETCDKCGEELTSRETHADHPTTDTDTSGTDSEKVIEYRNNERVHTCKGDAAWGVAVTCCKDTFSETWDCKLVGYPKVQNRICGSIARHIREFMGDWLDSYKAVINEECAPDEKHCTCVPYLRQYITTMTDAAQKVEYEAGKDRDGNDELYEAIDALAAVFKDVREE